MAHPSPKVSRCQVSRWADEHVDEYVDVHFLGEKFLNPFDDVQRKLV